MLQIKNTLGGGKPEGLYAWKKSEVVHVNGSATFSCIGSSSVTIKNANFKVNSIDDYVTFFNGFKVSDTEYYFNVNADGKLVQCKQYQIICCK